MAPARRWADVLDLPPRLIKPGPGVAARLGLRAASRAAGAAPPKRMTPPCEVDRVVALACTRRPCHGNYRRAERGQGKSGLCCCYGILPLRRRFGSEGPQRGPRDEAALKIERVVDGGMDAEEALRGSS
jgi:hypothetical protein